MLIQQYEKEVYLISAANRVGLNEVLVTASRQVTIARAGSNKHKISEMIWHPIDH